MKTKASLDTRANKGNIQIDSKPFLAKPYLDFIQNINEKKNTLDDSIITKKSNKSGEIINIGKDKLFELPQYPVKDGKIKSSKVSLLSGSKS